MPEGIQAGGNVKPKRIVQITSSGGNNKVIQAADASKLPYGISGQSVRYAEIAGTSLNDGFHAVAGENCRVFGLGEAAPIVAGGTIAAGDRIAADSDGRAVATTTNKDNSVGQALHAAASGEDVMVRVNPDQINS